MSAEPESEGRPGPLAAAPARGAPLAPGPELAAVPDPPARRRGRPLLVAGVVVVVLAGLVAVGVVPRVTRRAALRLESARAAEETLRVTVARPRRAPSTLPTSLPGSVEALRETTLYARTNGYVKRWLVDIGDAVADGQLLAQIATPELDQELVQAQASLAQARAALVQARASAALARVTAGRYDALAPSGVASHQEADEKRAASAVAVANVEAAEAGIRSVAANVARLEQLKAFARITAPFAGTVTTRLTEVGALVTAGNGQGQALFRVAQVDPVRVFVHVPQVLAPTIVVGQAARVEVRGLEGRAFTGTVTRTARAVDPATRSMLTEIQVPNRDHALMPGMYAQVTVTVTGFTGARLVPASALIVTGAGTQLAVLGPGDRVHLIPVRVDVDLGPEVAIADGLSGEERVIANPGEGLAEGLRVTPVAAAAPAGPAR
jgi:RND family efflux transporter MFP subunit